MDADLARKNTKLNQIESRAKYKKRYDCGANAETFKPGDKVLLRRTGPYPKMAVNWKEDANNNPFIVVKRVGQVKYSIKNSQGKQKIFHHNMIIPALNCIEAEHTLPNIKSGISEKSASSPVVIPLYAVGPQPELEPEHGQLSNQRVLDREAFTNNIFWQSASDRAVSTRSG